MNEQLRQKIMIVDDEPIVLDVTRSWLERAGYEVVTRDSAIGTMRAIRDEKPDLVLLDVGMPDLSGEALAQVIEKSRGTPRSSVVLFSSRDDKTLDRLATETGALGWIQKTSNEAAFIADVQTLFRKKHRITGAVGPIRVGKPAKGPEKR